MALDIPGRPSVHAWAFIPARGGSKSIPLKNMANLGGRPLLDYCVLAAKSSGCLERIVCSTEHPRIASSGCLERIVCSTEHPRIAERAAFHGIEHDNRPLDLCGDEVSTKAVLVEFLARNADQLPDLIFIVEPTSPFMRPQDITRLNDKIGR